MFHSTPIRGSTVYNGQILSTCSQQQSASAAFSSQQQPILWSSSSFPKSEREREKERKEDLSTL